MFVIISRQFPMNYGRTVSPGGITIPPYMAHGLGQMADPRVRTLDPGCPSSDSSIELLPGCFVSGCRKMGSYLFKNADSSTTTETETNETKVHNSKERVSDKINLNTLKADKKAKKAFWTYIPPKKLL